MIDWQTRAEKAEIACAQMKDVAEYLWAVVANASGGDWTKQSEEWQRAASRARDQYNKTISTDCGKGWVRVEELESTIVELNRLADLVGEVDVRIIQNEITRLEALVKGAEK